MRVFLPENVLTAAQARISRLFDEFPQVIVNTSGGKDSTVILHLALAEAERRNRLPLDVFFIDQEAEWDCVIDHIKHDVFADPRVRPWWFQMPMRIANATSAAQPWLYCWEEGQEANWIRAKDPTSIHVNDYGTPTFAKLFGAFTRRHFGDAPLAQLGGVRCEESPARMMGLTSYATYKDITWGNVNDRALGHYVFYPIYDWSYTDVWKAIHDHGWPYCPLYDYMYQYGIPTRNMRVSNVHHSTAIKTLTFMQEIEPQTWDRIVARVRGVNAVNQLQGDFSGPRDLPFMFKDWREYRDHLLANLIDPQFRPIFARHFESDDRLYREDFLPNVHKMHVAALLVNDYHGTKRESFVASHGKQLKSWSPEGGANRDRFTRRPA